MSAAKRRQRNDLDAKDERIDEVIGRAETVVEELKAAVEDLKRVLAAAKDANA